MSLRTRLVLLFTLAAMVVGAAGGALLARRLQLGLESDLDGVMRQRAASVAESLDHGRPDLTDAEGPVQLVDAAGVVTASSGGASTTRPMMDEIRQDRARGGVLIVDATEPLGGRFETARVLGQPAPGGGLILLATNRDPVDDVVNRTAVELALLGTPALILVATGVWLVTGAALRPVERMRAQAAAASPKDPTVLTVPSGKDEIARLAVTLNDLLAAQQAALRAEQSFLTDAGHELRTPLAILAGELEYADRPARSEAELRETITVAREETTRLVRLAEQLLVLARVGEKGLRRHPADLRELTEQARAAWSATSRGLRVEMVLRPGDCVIAVIDADRIRQVLDNLLANALRYAPAGSTIEISVDSTRGRAELTVRDHGPGFPPDFLPFAFERFRRADDSRSRGGPAVPDGTPDSSGTGLGLALVRTIAEAHRGQVEVVNCPPASGGGALVTLWLPLAPVGSTSAPWSPDLKPDAGNPIIK